MKILITGGCGFIGVNLANHFLSRNDEVVIIDNLSRQKTETNLEWLRKQFSFEFHKKDIRDFDFLKDFLAANELDVIFHLAAQVAVTTSVVNPREDFEINALGTFNLLEAIRLSTQNPIVIFSSTNKVYGDLADLTLVEKDKKYEFPEGHNGIDERRNLDFHSPYGCSKGLADQYIRDYARIYGLRTICFRQSCIYGDHQFGVEDQGWVAWFIIAALNNREITIYGNGKQSRDILLVDDLISAFEAALTNISKTSGNIYNIGGGIKNSLSLLELIEFLEPLIGKKIAYQFSKGRLGDQRIFASDNTKLYEDLGWVSKIDSTDGIQKLYAWCQDNIDQLRL